MRPGLQKRSWTGRTTTYIGNQQRHCQNQGKNIQGLCCEQRSYSLTAPGKKVRSYPFNRECVYRLGAAGFGASSASPSGWVAFDMSPQKHTFLRFPGSQRRTMAHHVNIITKVSVDRATDRDTAPVTPPVTCRVGKHPTRPKCIVRSHLATPVGQNSRWDWKKYRYNIRAHNILLRSFGQTTGKTA